VRITTLDRPDARVDAAAANRAATIASRAEAIASIEHPLACAPVGFGVAGLVSWAPDAVAQGQGVAPGWPSAPSVMLAWLALALVGAAWLWARPLRRRARRLVGEARGHAFALLRTQAPWAVGDAADTGYRMEWARVGARDARVVTQVEATYERDGCPARGTLRISPSGGVSFREHATDFALDG